MTRPKPEDFPINHEVISSRVKQYSKAQDEYIDFLEKQIGKKTLITVQKGIGKAK